MQHLEEGLWENEPEDPEAVGLEGYEVPHEDDVTNEDEEQHSGEDPNKNEDVLPDRGAIFDSQGLGD